MIISKYGIRLTRLTEDKIELVRQWRNHEKIKAVMDFQEYISPEMQKLWFDKINNHHHFYFIISYKEEEIGLIHTADINYTSKTAWSGLFIANQDYINSTVPIAASLAMLDFFMSEHDIVSTLYAKVMNINEKALGYNLNLGFEIEDENSSDKYKIIALHSEKYMGKSKSLKKVFQRWYSDKMDLDLENMDFEDAQEFLKKIKKQSTF